MVKGVKYENHLPRVRMMFMRRRRRRRISRMRRLDIEDEKDENDFEVKDDNHLPRVPPHGAPSFTAS